MCRTEMQPFGNNPLILPLNAQVRPSSRINTFLLKLEQTLRSMLSVTETLHDARVDQVATGGKAARHDE